MIAVGSRRLVVKGGEVMNGWKGESGGFVVEREPLKR